MIFKELIKKKRDGLELEPKEIEWVVKNFTEEKIPVYQMAALLMAVYFQGLSDKETLALTKAMVESGETLNISSSYPLVDKHSTGGIGDKVSLILAPILAHMGLNVAMLSGRALGFTGGTADKLESTGMKVELSKEEIEESIKRFGFSISTQTESIAPADRKIYSLRDATATVESIPLIVSSILSKKLAVNTSSIVFDVKVGTGAFMKTFKDAKELATKLVSISKSYGKRAAAVITEMSQPLGKFAGNSLEVEEALLALNGDISDDLLTVVTTLAGLLCELSSVSTFEKGAREAENVILSGLAYDRFVEWIKFWGGSLQLSVAKYLIDVKAPEEGFVENINGEKLGYLIVELGGGRKEKEDKVDHSVGLEFLKKIGDYVKEGEIIGRIYCNELKEEYVSKFLSAYTFSKEKVERPTLIKEFIR